MMDANERLEICKKCSIVKIDKFYGPRCDASKYINPETGEVSNIPLPGYKRGCNCFLKYKTQNPNSHCIAGKW